MLCLIIPDKVLPYVLHYHLPLLYIKDSTWNKQNNSQKKLLCSLSIMPHRNIFYFFMYSVFAYYDSSPTSENFTFISQTLCPLCVVLTWILNKFYHVLPWIESRVSKQPYLFLFLLSVHSSLHILQHTYILPKRFKELDCWMG